MHVWVGLCEEESLLPRLAWKGTARAWRNQIKLDLLALSTGEYSVHDIIKGAMLMRLAGATQAVLIRCLRMWM